MDEPALRLLSHQSPSNAVRIVLLEDPWMIISIFLFCTAYNLMRSNAFIPTETSLPRYEP